MSGNCEQLGVLLMHCWAGYSLSLLGKSQNFVTTDCDLKQQVRLLPDNYQHLNNHRNILYVGEHGVGKKTLVRHSWALFRQAKRPLVGMRCAHLKKPRQLEQCFLDAQNGDLFLEAMEFLPAALARKIPLLMQEFPAVRVLATSTLQTSASFWGTNYTIIQIPALKKRPADCQLLAQYFLQHEFQHLHLPAKTLATLGEQQKFASPQDIFTCIANLGLVCAQMGKTKVDSEVLHQVLNLSEAERLQYYLMYKVNSSGLYHLLDRYSLPDVCKLLENTYVANSMLETEYNQSLACQLLRIPTTTLSSKKHTLPFFKYSKAKKNSFL